MAFVLVLFPVTCIILVGLLFAHVESWFWRVSLSGSVVVAYFYLGIAAAMAVAAILAILLVLKSSMPMLSR
jgi:hypothetical protein